MRVMLRSTGQLGDIPDDKFDPSLFSVPSSHPQTQVDTGNPTQNPQSQGNPLLDLLLPTAGGIAGGIGGALIPGLGETGIGEVGGYAAGAGLGQTLSDLLQGKQPGLDVAGQVAGGAIGGGAGVIGGKVLGGILGGAGEGLASGGLNLTASQMANFATEHGQSVSQALTDSGLAGVDYGGLLKGIKPIQQSFNKIVRSKVAVDTNTLDTNLQSIVKPLLTGPTSNKRLAQQLTDEIASVKGDLGDNPTLADLNDMRMKYDQATPDNQFSASAHPQLNRVSGMVIRKTLQDEALNSGADTTGALPKIGSQLQKLYDLKGLADGRTLSGASGSPFSFSNLLFGGEAGFAGQALGIPGPLGAALAFGGRALLRNPAIAGVLSKGLSSAGQAVGKTASGAGAIAGGVGGGSLLGSLFPQGEQGTNNNNQANVNQNMTPSTGNIAQQDENGNYNLSPLGNAANRIPQLYPYENMIKDTQAAGGNPFRLEQIKQAYDASQQQAQEYAAKFQLPATEEGFMFNADNTNRQMNELRGLIQKEGTGWQNMLPGEIALKSYFDPQFGRMISLMTTLRSAAEYNQAHGRLSNFDIQQLNNMPNITDSKQSALTKLDANQKYLVQKYKQNLPFYGLNTFLNSGVNQVQQANEQGGGQVQNPLNAIPPQLQQQILGLPR